MTTLSKSLLSATIGASLLIAAYQAKRASTMREENQRLQQAIASPPTIHGATSPRIPPQEDVHPKRETPKESEEERLARLEAAADESIRQQRAAWEANESNRPVSYSLIERGGKGLTKGAAKAAGLSKGEQQAVADVLTKTWTIVSDDFARRATFIEEESNEEAGVSVYMVSARPDRGRGFKGQLERELDAAVGEEKRKVLMKGVQSDDFFAGFGKSDVRLEFLVTKGVFKFAFLNPLNGEPNCFGSHPFKEFEDQFGDSFEVPESSASPRYR